MPPNRKGSRRRSARGSLRGNRPSSIARSIRPRGRRAATSAISTRRAVFHRSSELVEDAASLAEAILEQIADAVIFADATGTIMRWNHAATALFGYSAAEALGQKLDLIIPDHLRAAHWRGFRAALTGGGLRAQGPPAPAPPA